ncbi:hypothetical protein [Nocardia sp. NRRL S-836]|uniref:hypothetical protein n=1 Tax=Nocardia sp. NRRL S-836 TaxID=1519492 RepID=UPI0006AF23BD|nr:hypothetical protein [Nocardia sp. NRRL S-836]KOV80106.1 hypothetical protein ADL03_34645 [Nocardia sp. NRRL S-836]
MTGERAHGPAQVVAGIGLVAWVVAFAVTTDVGNPPVLVAAAVSAGLVCLCPVAAGVLTARVVDAVSARRWRPVFVVLEGTSLAVFSPFYWSVFGVEQAGPPGRLAVGVVVVLAVPVVGALWLTMRASQAVHNVVLDANGPLVPGTGAGAPARRIWVLGTVLVTAGTALSVAVVAVALTAERYQEVYLVAGLLGTLPPVLLGVVLTRVQDVRSARRANVGAFLAVTGTGGIGVVTSGFGAGVTGVLMAAVLFGGTVLVVIAYVVVREYTGAWERPRQGRAPQGRARQGRVLSLLSR